VRGGKWRGKIGPGERGEMIQRREQREREERGQGREKCGERGERKGGSGIEERGAKGDGRGEGREMRW